MYAMKWRGSDEKVYGASRARGAILRGIGRSEESIKLEGCCRLTSFTAIDPHAYVIQCQSFIGELVGHHSPHQGQDATPFLSHLHTSKLAHSHRSIVPQQPITTPTVILPIVTIHACVYHLSMRCVLVFKWHIESIEIWDSPGSSTPLPCTHKPDDLALLVGLCDDM